MIYAKRVRIAPVRSGCTPVVESMEMGLVVRQCNCRTIEDLPANLERVLIGHDLRKEGSDRACKIGLHAGG